MMDSVCNFLDGYLEDMLGEDDRRAFANHLEHCEQCLRTIDEHRRLERLLSRAVIQASPVPAQLVQRIEKRLKKSSRRRMVVSAGAVAAAALLALGTLARFHHSGSSPDRRSDIPVAEEPVALPAQGEMVSAPARVKVLAPTQMVAVPVKTRDPALTIVWLYPTRQADVPNVPSSLNPTSPLKRSRR
jgi:anti-sigma factor RsiW